MVCNEQRVVGLGSVRLSVLARADVCREGTGWVGMGRWCMQAGGDGDGDDDELVLGGCSRSVIVSWATAVRMCSGSSMHLPLPLAVLPHVHQPLHPLPG